MGRIVNLPLSAGALILLFFGAMGCSAFEDVFEKEKEVRGIVEEVGADYLVVEAIRYDVTSRTEFEGVAGLDALSAGIEVEIEYEENGAGRTALEVDVEDTN